MFTYQKVKDETGTKYIYDGDLEEDLVSIGVQRSHIQAMKSFVIQNELPPYYKSDSNPCYIATIPLDRVVGFSRGDAGESLYSNITTIPEGNREPSSFKSCFSYVHAPFEVLYSQYENLCRPIDVDYDVANNAFYVKSDGNHRTMIAKLVHAPYIRARITNVYEDKMLHNQYNLVAEMYKKYEIKKIYNRGYFFEIVFNNEYSLIAGSKEINTSSFDNRIATFERLLCRIKMILSMTKPFPTTIQNAIIGCVLPGTYYKKNDLSESEHNLPCEYNLVSGH